MRAYIPDYSMKRVSSLPAALDLLSKNQGRYHIFAGGTDLMVVLEAGLLKHKEYLDISMLKELKEISVMKDHMRLGALCTYSCVARHPILQKEFPNLCSAARETGGVAIQNRGTIGGNIANASPAADTPPALLSYGASIELTSKKNGVRVLPYDSFHKGYKQTQLSDDELITAVILPRTSQQRLHYYYKVGTRRAQAIAKVTLAMSSIRNGQNLTDLKIACGSVAPVPLRCMRVEKVIVQSEWNAQTQHAVRNALAQDISPIDDIRSTRDYRLEVAQNVLLQGIGEWLEQGK